VGAVGAKLLYPDGRIQHAGIIIGMEGHASHVFAGVKEGYTGPFGSVNWYRDYSAVTGACLAVRREVFESVGGFDEGYELAFSDVDICQRILQKGYRVAYTPFARLLHHEGVTRNRYIPAQDIRRGAEHFKQVVKQGDPYYNPNLSYAIRIPTFRRPREEQPIVRLEKIAQFY
jgi:GT2 family glycosyltransferase